MCVFLYIQNWYEASESDDPDQTRLSIFPLVVTGICYVVRLFIICVRAGATQKNLFRKKSFKLYNAEENKETLLLLGWDYL